MNVVLDTNCLLMSLSRRSQYYPVWRSLVRGEYVLCYSNEQVYFHLKLIHQDPDDDKFVDCAFKSNAHFIVTQDHHYDILREIDFPKINVIDIDSFLKEMAK